MHLYKAINYVLKICDRHEFEHSIMEFHSSVPFGAMATGDFVKAKEENEGHPGQAFTHRIVQVYHYVYPTGKLLVHETKLIVEKSQYPNGL